MKLKLQYLALFALVPPGFAADVPPAPSVVDQIVAKVNGDIVSQDELGRFTRDLSKQLQAQGATPAQVQQELQKQQKDVLRNRIDELLLTQRGKELNINVDPEISKYLADLQRRAKISDPEKFHDFIREQSGMSYEDFLSETKNQYLTREVIGQEVGKRIAFTDKEIRDFYDAHKNEFMREEKVFLSEILISTHGNDPGAVVAAENKAKQMAAEAARGQRFAELARDNSDGVTAKDGGVLGGYKKGDLNKQFEDAVWNLPKGGVTPPLKIATGFEIFKVDDHTKAGLLPLADAKPEIENALYDPRWSPKFVNTSQISGNMRSCKSSPNSSTRAPQAARTLRGRTLPN